MNEQKQGLSCFPTKYLCNQGGKNIVEVFLGLTLLALFKVTFSEGLKVMVAEEIQISPHTPLAPNDLKAIQIIIIHSFFCHSGDNEDFKAVKCKEEFFKQTESGY